MGRQLIILNGRSLSDFTDLTIIVILQVTIVILVVVVSLQMRIKFQVFFIEKYSLVPIKQSLKIQQNIVLALSLPLLIVKKAFIKFVICFINFHFSMFFITICSLSFVPPLFPEKKKIFMDFNSIEKKAADRPQVRERHKIQPRESQIRSCEKR